MTALLAALQHNHPKIVMRLLNDPTLQVRGLKTKQGETVFHLVAQFGNSELLMLLLQSRDFIDNRRLLRAINLQDRVSTLVW